MLIAIEGVDGAGKRTLSEGLRKAFETIGMSVAALDFPRYGRSVTADLAAEALHGDGRFTTCLRCFAAGTIADASPRDS